MDPLSGAKDRPPQHNDGPWTIRNKLATRSGRPINMRQGAVAAGIIGALELLKNSCYTRRRKRSFGLLYLNCFSLLESCCWRRDDAESPTVAGLFLWVSNLEDEPTGAGEGGEQFIRQFGFCSNLIRRMGKDGDRKVRLKYLSSVQRIFFCVIISAFFP